MVNKGSPGVQERPPRSDLEAMLSVQGVLNPHPGEVATYLDSHSDLAAVLPAVCRQAHQEFGETAELTLEVYRDPEIDDRYLVLQVRLPSYGEATLAQIDRVSQPFEEELCQASGYLLVTTDLRLPERTMPFDWKAYIDLSRFLQQQAGNAGDPEAYLRVALSRAYYGAFCYARNYDARDWLGFHPRNDADDHGRLREHLKQKRRRSVADKLQRLREWRNECDYHDQLSFDPQTVLNHALKEANYVVSSLTPPAVPSPP